MVRSQSNLSQFVCCFFAAILAAVLAAAPAGAQTFRYASSGDVLSLDPHSVNEALTNGMKQNIYEGLLLREWDLSLEPGLAVSWSQPDPTTWRFKLRKGVTFHDGTPFNADDVVFSFHRNKHKSSGNSVQVADVKEVRKVDDYTVDYVTYGPSPVLLQNMPAHYIMSKKWCEEHAASEPAVGLETETYATRHANGTGAFMVTERVPDTRTVLVPNPNWWGNATKQHNLTRAEFRPIANAATRISALLSGEIDMMYPVPLQDTPRLKATPGFRVLQGPEVRVLFLGFDQWRDELLDLPGSGKNPFKDVRVRRAFYQAIDIETINAKVMRGVSRPTGLMVAEGIVGYDPKLNHRYPYDPTAAKKLLAEAGYPNGFPVTLDCPNDRYINDEAICQAVVPMLARVSVKVSLNAQTKSKWIDKTGRKQNNNTSFYLLGWVPNTFDAHNTFLNTMVLHGDGAGLWNHGRYTNPKVEELVAAIAVEIDLQKRSQMISEVLRIHKEDVGHIPLLQPMLVWGVRDGVDVKLQAADQVLLRYVNVIKSESASRSR